MTQPTPQPEALSLIPAPLTSRVTRIGADRLTQSRLYRLLAQAWASAAATGDVHRPGFVTTLRAFAVVARAEGCSVVEAFRAASALLGDHPVATPAVREFVWRELQDAYERVD